MNEASKYEGLVLVCFVVQPRSRGFGLDLELEYMWYLAVNIGNKNGFVGFMSGRLVEFLEFREFLW